MRRQTQEGVLAPGAAAPDQAPKVNTSTLNAGEVHEDIAEDDLCPICQLLLYRPVLTSCNHALCESCMAHWADVSVSSQLTIVDVDEEPVEFNPVSGLEAKCPMCRTQTAATLDAARSEQLASKYPSTWLERAAEEGIAGEGQGGDGVIQTFTVYVGNRHQLVQDSEDANVHEWTFFVKTSRTDIIEEVQILLVSPPQSRADILLIVVAPNLQTKSSDTSASALPDQAVRLGLLHGPSVCHLEGRLQLGVRRCARFARWRSERNAAA